MNPTPDGDSAGLPLQGIRILDLATVVAAPLACTLCADLGAEVVKVELPGGNDTLRALAPVWEGHALFWKTGNRGKQGITLDVRTEEGRGLLLRMLPQFDVLVENFRTGTLDSWGLDIATLHAANPRLVVLRLTGFGQTGPSARRPGFARIFEAMSGYTHLTGEPGRPPQHMNYPLGDAISGLFGAFAIASALVGQVSRPLAQRVGAEIDLSATEALLRLLDPLAAEHRFLGEVRSRAGSRATYTAPSNVFASADGHWITLVGTGDAVFRRLCAAMGQLGLLQDPRFENGVKRIRHGQALDAIVAAWVASLPAQEACDMLARHEVPHTRVNSIADIAADPHLQARQALIELADEDLGSVPAPCVVPRFAGAAPRTLRTGPRTGEHNAAFYRALGLSESELRSLTERKII